MLTFMAEGSPLRGRWDKGLKNRNKNKWVRLIVYYILYSNFVKHEFINQMFELAVVTEKGEEISSCFICIRHIRNRSNFQIRIL